MHLILLGDEIAPPVRRASVVWVEQMPLAVTNEEAALISDEEPGLSLPSDDDISSLPSPISSPNIPIADEPLDHGKQDGSLSPLPRSSPLSSSPGPNEEEESPPGRVHFFEKVGHAAQEFRVPSTNGFFSVLNSGHFVRRTRVITHPLEVYDTMMGNFVHLPPTAYWRQYSPRHYLILREQGLNDGDCPGLEELIKGLDDPVDIMSKDESCIRSWSEDSVLTPPPCGQPRFPASSPVQCSSDVDAAEENIPNTIQTIVRYKRKLSPVEDDVSEPPQKVLKLFEGGSGDTVLDPIFIMEEGPGGDSLLDPIFLINN